LILAQVGYWIILILLIFIKNLSIPLFYLKN